MLFNSLKSALFFAFAFLVIATGLSISQLVAHRFSISLLDRAVARAENIAHNLALDAADKILINDLVALQKILDDQIASDPTVAYLFVSRDGQVLTHTFTDGIPVHLIQANTAGAGENPHTQKLMSQEGERYIDVAYPIFSGKAGTLRMGMAVAPYLKQVRQLWVQMSIVTLGILVLSLAVSQWAISRLTRPLNQLGKYAGQIDAGNLNTQVTVRGRREVSQLAGAFNSMLARIEDYTARLKHSNEQLETKNRELDRTHKQLKTSLSISQKIAALPKLDQICRFLIQALTEVVACRDIHLLVFSRTLRTVNLSTLHHIYHLDQERFDQLYALISRYEQFACIHRPELARIQLPGALNSAVQVALFPIRHHDETIGAMMVACGGDCECATHELDIVAIILQQAAGAIHRANTYEEELTELKHRVDVNSGFGEIIGKDPKMQLVFKLIEDVAPTDATVLIQGESGTGKELVARAIHQRSHRAAKPFIVINCAAYPSTLLESELFGHEKGAFTGAVRRKIGRFEQADGGTVFLDEIGDIDPVAQTKLLRVLQQQIIDRLGGEKPIKVDVRILAATNKNLTEEVRKGIFREDLFYRLNVIPIHLPALRERSGDIHLLAQHFLNRFCTEQRKKIIGFRSEALRKLIESPWQGNVRELENSIEHAVVLSKGPQVELKDLPSALLAATSPKLDPSTTIVESEARLIREKLEACNWNKAVAARQLGISRSTLYEKLKKLKIAHSA
ncbi:MAG: HAMP domain-containing protein [Desulfobacteraceae bacterium]|nr:MAG: HAMP domain-containing protein [Desulfobacteraceae bacterium]